MRPIDADALIVEIKTCLWDWETVNGIMAKTVLNQTITDIGNMPTIDAVPVIRCKDCRFYRFYDGTFGKGWMCFENDTARHGDDYCSRGERKDDE